MRLINHYLLGINGLSKYGIGCALGMSSFLNLLISSSSANCKGIYTDINILDKGKHGNSKLRLIDLWCESWKTWNFKIRTYWFEMLKLLIIVPFVVFPFLFSVVLSNSIFQPPTQLNIHQFYISWCVKLKGKERVDEICTWWSNSARSIALKSLWSFTSIGFVLSFTGGFSKHCNKRMLRLMHKLKLPTKLS